MMATGAKAEVVEVGYFGAGQFIPCEELSAGMVGYITASLKNVKDTRVGDTVTNAAHPCAEPLPGYKKVNQWFTVDYIRQMAQNTRISGMRWRNYS